MKNRFKKEDRELWWDWNECYVCGENRWDALHHIIAQSSKRWKKGKFNSSILNSAPIHNEKCHLYNSDLHKKENEKEFLQRTYNYLVEEQGYTLKEKDKKFLNKYSEHYDLY